MAPQLVVESSDQTPLLARSRSHGSLHGDGPSLKTKVLLRDPHTKVTSVRKLMISAQLLGNEACMSYEQLYAVPILQTLGLPLSLVSFTGFLSGTTSVILLPALGWWVDRGSNPLRRKTGTAVVASVFLTASLVCLIVANIMHLVFLSDYNLQRSAASNASFRDSSDTRVTETARLSSINTDSYPVLGGHAIQSGLIREFNVTDIGVSPKRGMVVSTVENVHDFADYDWHSSGAGLDNIPAKAILGFAGIVLMEIGYDLVGGLGKTFSLACCPRQEHTSLLVLGMLMASTGGLSTTIFGVLDFPYLLGVSFPAGGELSVQTAAQAFIIIVFVIAGLAFAVGAGYRERRRQALLNSPCDCHHQALTMTTGYGALPHASSSRTICSSETCFSQGRVQAQYDFKRSCLEPAEDLQNEGNQDVQFPQELLSEQEQGDMRIKERAERCLFQYNHNFANTLQPPDKEGGEDSLHFPGAARNSCGIITSAADEKIVHVIPDIVNEQSSEYLCPMTDRSYGEVLQDTANELNKLTIAYSTGMNFSSRILNRSGKQPFRKSAICTNVKVRIAFVCVSVVFGIGQVVMFSLMTSDFVGKAIYGGSPVGPPASEALTRYQAGMRMASWGWLTSYGSYLVSTLINNRLLAMLGCRLELVLAEMLMSASMVALALTNRLEAFFLLAVAAGFQRACFFVIPFVVTSDIMQANAGEGNDDGKSRLGLAINLVTASIPLGYLGLFTWVGPLEAATGIVSMALWLGALFGCLSSLAFLFVGKT